MSRDEVEHPSLCSNYAPAPPENVYGMVWKSGVVGQEAINLKNFIMVLVSKYRHNASFSC